MDNKYDLVYIVRSGDENEELRTSLRSIEKYAPKHDGIVIVGYKPTWLNDKITYIPTNQTSRLEGWLNAKLNLLVACKSPKISDNFILMNDDFIATRPITDWNESLLKVKNTIPEQITEYNNIQLNSRYTRAFAQTLSLLRQLKGDLDFYNYELHIPMIINKRKFLDLLKDTRIANAMSNVVTLYRSIYGNMYSVEFNEIMEDVKFYDNDPKEIATEWISTFDNWIGDPTTYPVLNKFIDDNFPEKSSFEV
jgi:hypothetical protein